jgi:hypothetical protein
MEIPMRKTAIPSLGAARIRGGTLPLLLLGLLVANLSAAQSAAPGPVDPLTASESQLAATNAQNDPQVRSLLGSGRQVLGSVEFIALSKGPADNEDPSVAFDIGRFATVTFCRYSGNLGVSAVVNLRSGAVSQVISISCDDVVMTVAELQAARDLAIADSRVRALLGADAATFQVQADPDATAPANLVQGLRVQNFDSTGACYQRRCLSLLFRRGNAYIQGTEVVVDLTAQTVTLIPQTQTNMTNMARRQP